MILMVTLDSWVPWRQQKKSGPLWRVRGGEPPGRGPFCVRPTRDGSLFCALTITSLIRLDSGAWTCLAAVSLVFKA
jgi:hypothetical protein